jgi:hypothetical protein
VLAGDNRSLSCALRSQISALEEKKRRIEITIDAVRSAEAALRSGHKPCLKHIIEVMEMQNDYGWILQHFSDEARPRAEDRLASIAPGTLSVLQREWNELAQDIQAAEHSDPTGPEGQALLSRWENLVRQTTGDDKELIHGLKSLYSDRTNWPERVRTAVLPLLDECILNFLRRAVAARAS